VKLLRAYVALIKVSWAKALEYRAQIIIWMISFVFPLIMMAVWLAVVAETGPTAGWTRSDFISYYVAAVLVNRLTFSPVIWDWDDDMRTGNLSTKLVKPLDPFHYLISEQIGWQIFFLVLMLPAIIAASFLIPAIRYPLTPTLVALVALSLVLGFVLNTLMGAAIAMLGFWSTQTQNIYSLWWGVGQFVSGWIAPLAMYPESVRSVGSLLPFRSTLGFPIEMLMGRLDAAAIRQGFAVALVWSLVFLVAYRLLWRAGLKRYDAVGG
jgi:ABC-2 type transport system permease protein